MYYQSYEIILDYSIDKIFNLLSNIKQYVSFFPYIKELLIKNTYYDNCGTIIGYDALVILQYLLIRLNYQCSIKFNWNNHRIEIEGFGGSFKFINAFWQLDEICINKTKISYYIEFELKSFLQQKMAKKIFEINTDKTRRQLIRMLQKSLDN